MNRKSLAALVGVTAAIGASVLAGPAASAPGDVTAAASVDGRIVTVKVTNNSTEILGCYITAYVAPATASSEPVYGDGSRTIAGEPYGAVLPGGGAFTFTLHSFDEVDGGGAPVGTTAVDDGTYDVGWICGWTGVDTWPKPTWGTADLVEAAASQGGVDVQGTVPWMTITVPGNDGGPDDCSGSLCGLGITLPGGS